MRTETAEALARWWASVFDTTVTDLWRGGVHVCAHTAALGDYCGIYVFHRADTVRISAPAELVPRLGAALAHASQSQLLDITTWRQILAGQRIRDTFSSHRAS